MHLRVRAYHKAQQHCSEAIVIESALSYMKQGFSVRLSQNDHKPIDITVVIEDLQQCLSVPNAGFCRQILCSSQMLQVIFHQNSHLHRVKSW